jgi:hypothetical protein
MFVDQLTTSAPAIAFYHIRMRRDAQPRIHASPGMLRRAAPRNRARLPSGEVTNSFARRSAGRAVAPGQRSSFRSTSVAGASRVPLRRRAPELVTSPPGSPAHAQSPPYRLPPPRPAPALIPGRVATIAPGRPSPVAPKPSKRLLTRPFGPHIKDFAAFGGGRRAS